MKQPPPRLYAMAERAASAFGSTADRKMIKALRDIVRRWARQNDIPYGACPVCRGLTLAGNGCLECEEGRNR